MIAPMISPSSPIVNPPESVKDQPGHYGRTGNHGPKAESCASFARTGNDDHQGETPQGNAGRHIQHAHSERKYASPLLNSIPEKR